MTGPADRIKDGLAHKGKAAIGASLATGALTAVSAGGQKLGPLFRRRYPTVAVTGMTGVGKSRLADRLSRRSNKSATHEVGSATMEKRTRRSAKMQGFRFMVVPGDNAATRLAALDSVFHDDPADGVIHVVANGYATPRRAAGISGSAIASREDQLSAELEDWTITAHRIASMAVRRDKPVWLIIAVTKVDLFPGDLDAALRYYSPGSGSAFGNKVDELRALAGAAKLSIDVLPVCAEGGDRRSSMSSKRCSAMIDALATRMSQLSGHV